MPVVYLARDRKHDPPDPRHPEGAQRPRDLVGAWPEPFPCKVPRFGVRDESRAPPRAPRIRRRCWAAAALRFLDGVAADPSHEVVDVDRDLQLAAVERWLRRYADQEFSLTDATAV